MAYGQSKFANILFSNELARRAKAAGTGITANAVHPGFIHTDLKRHLEDHITGTGNFFAPILSQAQKWIFSAAMETDSGALTQVIILFLFLVRANRSSGVLIKLPFCDFDVAICGHCAGAEERVWQVLPADRQAGHSPRALGRPGPAGEAVGRVRAHCGGRPQGQRHLTELDCEAMCLVSPFGLIAPACVKLKKI